MPHLIKLTTHKDNRGSLTVIQQEIGFKVKRIFYLYHFNNLPRGGHRHRKTIQGLVCLSGEISVTTKIFGKTKKYLLNRPDRCLILEPQDWNEYISLKPNSILLVLASTNFDADDYIDEPLR